MAPRSLSRRLDRIFRAGHRPDPGFTLIEIMVVVVILAILATIIVPNVINKPEEARITKAKADIRSIVAALDMYKLDNYQYPTTSQGLKALVVKPSSSPIPPHWHHYLNQIPIDPWGHPYKYLYPGVHGTFDVWTDGPPGSSSHHRVIGNWNLDRSR
jgi:general secretion pathway protein G